MTAKIDPERLRWAVKRHPNGWAVFFEERTGADTGMGITLPDEATARLIAAAPALLRFLALCRRPNRPLTIDINRLLDVVGIEIVTEGDRGD